MKSVGWLGWLAVGASIASTVVTFMVDDKWIRAASGLFAAALMIGWSVALIRRGPVQPKA